MVWISSFVLCRGSGRGHRCRDGGLGSAARQFEHAQAGLDGEGEQGVVSAADPAAAAVGVEQGVDLLVCEERHVGAVEALVGIARTRAMRSACSGCWKAA